MQVPPGEQKQPSTGQDLQQYKKAAELAYQYAKNKVEEEENAKANTEEPFSNKEQKQEET